MHPPSLLCCWALCNKLWLMVAVSNLIWTLYPQILLFFPNIQRKSEKNMTYSNPLSDITHKPFSEEQRLEMREEARRMFYWGYDNYITHAFPFDELNPINCTGRGHDWTDRYVRKGRSLLEGQGLECPGVCVNVMGSLINNEE